MKIVLVGRKQKKLLEFNDDLLAIKLMENGKQTYYKMIRTQLKRLYNKKAKELVDALIDRGEE